MNNKVLLYSVIYISGVIIASFSQIILKKSADKQYECKWSGEYNGKINIIDGFVISKKDNKKLSVLIKNEKLIREYINVRVITAYGMFFFSSLLSVLAYKYVPLSFGPILGAAEYVFIAILSRLILKEHINHRKIFGLAVIIAGIVVYSVL